MADKIPLKRIPASGDATALHEFEPGDTTGVSFGGTGLSTIAVDQMLYTSAPDTLAATSLAAFGRSLIDDTDDATARTTLGLGGASVLDVGTAAGTVAAGDDSRFLTTVDKTDLTDAGDSTLHYHATDRARANHTGTQLLSTISDAGTAAAATIGTSGDTVPKNNAANVWSQIQDFSAAGAYFGGSASKNLLNALDTALNWTPVLSCDVPGDLAITYTQQNGYGTVIANRLVFNISLIISSYTHTTASGGVTVSLPTTSSSATGNVSTPCVNASRWTPPASYTTQAASIPASSAVIQLQKNGITDTPTVNIQVGEFSTASGNIVIRISGSMKI